MPLYQSIAEVSRLIPDASIHPRFFHLINPFVAKPGSEHENAQRITFECIRRARHCFREDSVEVVGVVSPEEGHVVPEDFACSAVLSRSVKDLIESPRPFPLLFDILSAPLPGGEALQDDYIIYTNIDIAPVASFYHFVNEVAIRGFDAFAINRRTVDAEIGGGADFGMMQCEMGKTHPGTDCLVFRRSLLGKFIASECCLGVTAVMKSLLYNLAAFSENMLIFKDAHATFHLGDDRQWSDPAYGPLAEHNKSEARRIASELAARGGTIRLNLERFATERSERALLRVLGLPEPSGPRSGERRKRSGGESGASNVRGDRLPKPGGSGARKAGKALLRKLLGKEVKNAEKGADRREPGQDLPFTHRLRSGEAALAKEANIEFLKPGVEDVRLLDYLVDPVPLVLDAQLQRGRSAPNYAFGLETLHPFVIAARVALGSTESQWRSRIREVLECYYRIVTPATFGEISGAALAAEVAGLPTYAHVFPWERSAPTEKVFRMSGFVEKENSRRGLVEGVEGGWTWVGPVSPNKLEVETDRLADLLVSISTKGYQRSDIKDGDIRGVVLMKTPREWVWMATGGQHRACVLSALGNRECPLRIKAVVRRDDASVWPNVVRGIYSKEQALLVFDRIFCGDYSHLSGEWEQHVRDKGWV